MKLFMELEAYVKIVKCGYCSGALLKGGYPLEEAHEHCSLFLDYQYKGFIMYVRYHYLSYYFSAIYIS
jgi:hypothetical protein